MIWACHSGLWVNTAQWHIDSMCKRKTASDHNTLNFNKIWIWNEIEDEEADKTLMFTVEKRGKAQM